MKAVILALAIAGVASTASLNAQIVGTRLPTPSTSTSRGTSVNGSWQVVGQDRYGTLYERRTYDSNGNIVVQTARRDVNGNFSIINTRTVRDNNTNTNNRDCQYANSNGTVGDIIYGRNGSTNCNYNNGSADGVWRQVGQGRNNNSVYERRTYDRNGNLVIQKARRNPDGSFRILSSRTVNSNNGVRNRNRDDQDDQGDNRGRGHGNGHGKKHGDNEDRNDNRRGNDN